jgi:hypothetical protein
MQTTCECGHNREAHVMTDNPATTGECVFIECDCDGFVQAESASIPARPVAEGPEEPRDDRQKR